MSTANRTRQMIMATSSFAKLFKILDSLFSASQITGRPRRIVRNIVIPRETLATLPLEELKNKKE